ncbi:hypothetical protein E2C01_095746 [Portunus trituberculatus]|uniref:Uncharacterized protein n=1 Tax=Portunus trituberculatus TaxID=210409 RepID=A0A5B7K6J5_PORTR|nr:hypothetical protein [Portunus trituberculatus]
MERVTAGRGRGAVGEVSEGSREGVTKSVKPSGREGGVREGLKTILFRYHLQAAERLGRTCRSLCFLKW